VSLSQFLKLVIKMLSKVLTFSCLLAVSLAAPAADEAAMEDRDGKQLLLAGAGLGLGYHHAAVAPLAPVAPVLAPNCAIEHEEIETQVCTPRAETVCETKEVIAQAVKYEKVCKEVTSKHCAGGIPGHVVAKREADPEAFYGHGLGYGLGLHAPIAAPVAYAAHEETITSPCHEVVSEHCLNNPVIEETPVPIEQCHVVNKVDCVPEVQKIAKTVCTPVESKVVRHLAHPFAYHYGKK
jgi:hypothetical protein